MAKRPTYEKLEQRIRELEKKNFEIKQEEELLREGVERLKTILNFIQAGIVIIDTKTHKIFDVNFAAAQVIGVPKEKIVGRLCHNLMCSAINGACPITDLGGKIENSESLIFRSDGGKIPIIKTCTPIDLRGREYLLLTFIDISDKKKLEAQLIQAQKMEAIGTLAGGIAHDFNNLLMGIQGYASLMLMDIDSTHPHYERLTGIEEQVQRGAELTRHLLGFARGGKFEDVSTDLNKLIRKTSGMFGRTKKEIEIHRRYQKDIYSVDSDQGQIEQVLLNLYVNAWQAMPGGGKLYLQTENVFIDENHSRPYKIRPGRYVKISVKDTGVGMDETTRQRVFEPFFSTKEMGRGTGLGLASVYGIIKNHGGFIDVYSEKGEGTTFDLFLPASENGVVEGGDSDEKFLEGSETILLVDDEDMIINVGEQFLKKMGYTVLIAKNGKDAVEICEKGRDKIDIVILDMIMPDMGGGETYDRIKEVSPGMKVLLSSGYSLDGQVTEILVRGCNGFIQKPFDIKQLSQSIREVLDGK